MKKKQILMLLIVLVWTLLPCVGCGNYNPDDSIGEKLHKETEIHFINVSNLPDVYYMTSMCILIRYGNYDILIDSGTEIEGSKQIVAEYLTSLGIKKINYLILTHAHDDHAGGMSYQIEQFDIGNAYLKPIDWSKGDYDLEHKFYDEIMLALQDKVNSDGTRPAVIEPKTEGMRVEIDNKASLTFYNCQELFENQVAGQDFNSFSMQIKFTYKKASIFIGGDAFGGNVGGGSDGIVLGHIGQCDLYSVQHHGTGLPYTTQDLLDELQPKISVVNGVTDYFDEGTKKRLQNIGSEIYVTGEEGNIIFDCDGKQFMLRQQSESTQGTSD